MEHTAPSKATSAACYLVLAGVAVAVLDIVADSFFLVRPHESRPDTGYIWLLVARGLCYLVVVPLAFHLARRLRADDDAPTRIGLIALMIGCTLGSTVNFAVSGSVTTGPSATWTISAICDGLLLALALTTTGLLLFPRRAEPGRDVAAVSSL